MRALLIAAVALAAATAQANAASSACNLATAKQAVRQTKLTMKMLGDPQRVDPASASQVICFDFTRDGRTDVAVTFASGGTAGDIGFAVFRATAAGWAIALKQGGYKIGIYRVGGDLVTSQPVYKANDPNCCPTGGFDHDRFHWNGATFVRVRSYHTKSYKP